MNSGGKGLAFAGIVIVAILIISAGFYVYKSGFSKAGDNLSSYSTEQTEAYNSQFEMFLGSQPGTSLNSLISKLITNANQYKDELTKIPTVTIKNQINKSNDKVNSAKTPQNNSDFQNYIKNLTTIKQKLESNHTYNISATYGEDSFINEFIISY